MGHNKNTHKMPMKFFSCFIEVFQIIQIRYDWLMEEGTQLLHAVESTQIIHAVEGTQLLHAVEVTQLLHAVESTQLIHAVEGTQLLHAVEGTQLLHTVEGTQLLHAVEGTQLLHAVDSRLSALWITCRTSRTHQVLIKISCRYESVARYIC
jgi:hypothetical protein